MLSPFLFVLTYVMVVLKETTSSLNTSIQRILTKQLEDLDYDDEHKHTRTQVKSSGENSGKNRLGINSDHLDLKP